jgi:signal transduction histidine kinase/ActR/RegA family two-component response regulator
MREKRIVRIVENLNYYSEAFASIPVTNLKEVGRVAVALVSSILTYQLTAVLFIEEEDGEPRLLASKGINQDSLDAWNPQEALIRHLLRDINTSTVFKCKTLNESIASSARRLGLGDMFLAVPLIAREYEKERIGFVIAARPWRNYEPDLDIMGLEIIAGIVTGAISNCIGRTNLLEANERIQYQMMQRRRAEEERKKLEARLQQTQKLEAIGTLAGGIAHDFNNALVPIIVNTQMALMAIPDGSSLQPLLEGVLKAGGHAKNLVSQILAFSRQADQEQQPVQMIPLIKETLKLLRSTLPSTIKIDEEFQAASDTVIADPTQIHQIMLNLGTNAAHAMVGKGGMLSVSLTDIDVGSGTAAIHPDLRTGPYVRLTVSDTGHGMERAITERIFEPFFTTKDPGKGTGMGLSTVHGIVKSHGGAIIVDSEPLKGSTFHVYLPLSDIKPTEDVPTTKYVPMGTEHILLVDDEEWILTTAQQLLEHLGYKVTALTSSLKALEAFRAQPHQFDLVVTDIIMPDMTGEVLARELLAIQPNLPIIVFTGYSEHLSEDKAKKMGFAAYFMKPVNVQEMARTIRKVLDKD